MAKGQKTFSSSGRKVVKLEFKPLPPGEYELKLNAKTLEIKTAAGPGKLPYINASVEALGTGGDSGKNRRVYHRFFLDTTPSKKDGVSMVERGAGLVAFARAGGVELDGIPVVAKTKINDDGSSEEHEILDPKAVLEFLKGLDGSVISAKVKVTPADGNYGPKNEIEYFIEGEPADSSDDEDEDEDEEDGESEDEEVEDEDGDDEDEDEEVPAPKKLVKKK